MRRHIRAAAPMLLVIACWITPLFAQNGNHRTTVRGQNGAGTSTSDRQLKTISATMSKNIVTGELKVKRSSLQHVIEVSSSRQATRRQRRHSQNMSAVNDFSARRDSKSLKRIVSPVATTKTTKRSTGSRETIARNPNIGGKTVKGMSKVSKGTFVDPVPTKPSRPSPLTPSAKRPTASPTTRPITAATPFDIEYIVPRRLAEGRRLQTTDDYVQASLVTIDYLRDYIITYFQQRGIAVSAVGSTATTYRSDPLSIGYVLSVTFIGRQQDRMSVDKAITLALTLDGVSLVAALQTALLSNNPFSQTADLKVRSSIGGTFAPSNAGTPAPTSIDSRAPITSGTNRPTTGAPQISPTSGEPPTNVDSFRPSPRSSEPTAIDSSPPALSNPTGLGPTVSLFAASPSVE